MWTADIHESVSPGARLKALQRALRVRLIPGAFHYETPRQAQKWLELHEAYSPARRDKGAACIYQAAGEALAAHLPPGEVLIVGLGCGGGEKDRALVQACLARGMTVHYAPVDISLPLVLAALQAAGPLIKEGGGRLFPLIGDLTAEEDWRRWWQSGVPRDVPCVFTFYGLLPTLSPKEIRDCLTRWLTVDAWLLLSANLIPTPGDPARLTRVLPQYDNQLTRQWLGIFLEDLGVPELAGHIEFGIEKFSGSPAVWAIVADWVCHRPVEVVVDGVPFRFETSERLRLFTSYRYTPGQVMELIMPVGPRVVESWVNPSVEEGVFFCTGGAR